MDSLLAKTTAILWFLYALNAAASLVASFSCSAKLKAGSIPFNGCRNSFFSGRSFDEKMNEIAWNHLYGIFGQQVDPHSGGNCLLSRAGIAAQVIHIQAGRAHDPQPCGT